MKKLDVISSAALLSASLTGQSAIAGSMGDDTLLIVDGPAAETDLIGFAPNDHLAEDDLFGFAPGAPADLSALLDAEYHGTYFSGKGGDMIRVPGTALIEVTGPDGRSGVVQFDPDTRTVYTPSGEKVDPPDWLVRQLRAAQ